MTRYLGLALVAIALVGITVPSQAAILVYDATLNGPNEGNASPGTGFGQISCDNVLHTLHVSATFSGLVAPTTAAHMHSATAMPGIGTAGVATTTPSFAGFPLGVTKGTYDNTLDMTLASSWNPAYIIANGGTPGSAEVGLASGIAAGKAYPNIHTSAFPAGEIRGFLVPAPEPVTLGLLAAGSLAMLRGGRLA
jgi:hypothetical protein